MAALEALAESGGRVGFSQVPSIDELAEDAKSVASVDNKAKIAVSLVSGQLSKAPLDSRDDYILQATEAVEVLNALVHGGVVAGHQIPSMDELSDNLRKLNEGVHDLMTGLGVLAAGGTVNGQNVPGLDTTVSGLKNLSEGVGSPAKGTAALKAGSGTGMGDGHRRRAMGRARSPWAEGHSTARHCCRPKTTTLFTDHVAGSCTLSAHLPRAPRKVQEPVQPQSSAAGKSRRKWFLSALPLR